MQFMQRVRVPMGFVLAPLLFLAARPTKTSMVAGTMVASLGLLTRAWASGHLKKNEVLTRTGPYAYTRNPLYFGTLILGTGVSICTGTAWFVVLFVLLYLVVYFPVMIAEADTMESLFPGQYELYKREVPLFFPRLARSPSSVTASKNGAAGYDQALYLRHREYRAALGVAIVLVLLGVEALLR
ncbi:MAG TPA: methyltransferase [Blastocatellia bacterium]|nr:methyltransferase [Blastocatellia bacterium]